ncbi:TRAP-type C4-dicarboxylate transport system permease small subunit [Roseovarius sp. MBR-51]
MADSPPSTTRGPMAGFLRAIDSLSTATAILSALALLIITIVVCYEVTSRYVFNSPTIWAWDINTQLMLAMIMLGLANVHRRDRNIAVDVLIECLPERAKAALGVLFGLLLIFLAATITWIGWPYFHQSLVRGQAAPSLFAPPLWPVKFMIPMGAFILLLQAIARIIRDAARFLHPTDNNQDAPRT